MSTVIGGVPGPRIGRCVCSSQPFPKRRCKRIGLHRTIPTGPTTATHATICRRCTPLVHRHIPLLERLLRAVSS